MLRLIPLILAAALSLTLHAYDAQKAALFHDYYQNFTQERLAASTLFADAEEVVALLQTPQPPLLLDVRTEAEAAVAGLTLDNALFIPLERLFTPESLDRLPEDRTIVIVCHSGVRAAMAATALQMSGIRNVRVLKGGLSALALAATPGALPRHR